MVTRRICSCCLFALALVFTFIPAASSPAQAVANATALQGTALGLVPKDAAFFATNLNLRKAWDDFLAGDFVTRLRQVPFFLQLEDAVATQWENPQGQLLTAKGYLKNPNIKSLIELLVDMNSQEMFYFGGSDWNDSIGGLMSLYGDLNSLSDDPVALQQFITELDAEYLDNIKIPTTVVGFRLSRDDTATSLLDALQGLLQIGLAQVPELAPISKQITRKDFSDGQVLSLTLTTQLLPLDKIDADVREKVGGLIEGLAGRKLVLSIGLRSKTLLLSVSEDLSPILTFGKGELLLNHDRLSILQRNIPRDLRSVSFVSKEWRESQFAAKYGSYFQQMFGQFAMAVTSENSEAVDVEGWQEDILSDAASLDAILNQLDMSFDSALSWSFVSDNGVEGFTYDWSENVVLENAQPMSILKHTGTQPLLLWAMKLKPLPVIGELIEKTLDIAPDHLRKFISLAEQVEEDRETALKSLEKGWPIVVQAYEIFIDEILPAVDERELLWSFAAQWTTSDLSPDGNPLPLPEFAVAFKLRNRDQFLTGCQKIYDTIDRIVDLVRDVVPESISPNYSVPRPQQERLAGAIRFYYPDFADLVQFEGFEPQIVVGKDTVIVGFTSRQVLDMTEEKPLATRPGWQTPEAPTASLTLIDLTGMVSAVSPWLSNGFLLTMGDLDTPLAMIDGPVPTGRDVIQIWDCLSALGKQVSTTVINHDDVTITRWLWMRQ